MTDITTIGEAFATAELWHIIALSLSVSISAAAIATILGLPLGVILAIGRFPGRDTAIVAANSFLGLPPVFGLALHLLLSHAGPLCFFGLLFTPIAMVAAQSILALPIVTALAHRAAEDLWAEYGDALQVFGASKSRAVPVLIDTWAGSRC